jgi:signal transduction histidine kinase
MFGSIGLPHGFCFLWNPALLRLHVVSDSLIALAYFLIPLALVRIVNKRRDIPYNSIFFCFAAFIIACGITHGMEVVTLWYPVYWISGMLKAFTAIISLVTFLLLLRITPALLAIPSQEELKSAYRQLNSVLESTSVGVIAIDHDWRINYLNGNAKILLNVDNDIRGALIWETFPGRSPESQEKLIHVMTTREPVSFEAYDAPLDHSISVQIHPWEDGGITIFFTDISQQRRLQRELDRERVLRDQRIEALAHMAGGLAHEISNPLGIIHARASDLAEVAQESLAVPSTVVYASCNSIVRTSDRAMRILRGLQMFAREGSRDPMQIASIAPLVEQTVDLIRNRYDTHGIMLETSLPADLPPVECREVQIVQILLNLLNNAFDAIDASPHSERWVKVCATSLPQSNGFPARMQIDVIDGGPGVAEEHRVHLMEAFFTTKPVGAGIGVGLSLSRAIAQDHNGSLELTGVDGHTCFRLMLPLGPEPQNGVTA